MAKYNNSPVHLCTVISRAEAIWVARMTFVSAEWQQQQEDMTQALPPPPPQQQQRLPVTSGEPPVVMMGKMPLRRCFPDVTSAWRRKDPIEVRQVGTAVLL